MTKRSVPEWIGKTPDAAIPPRVRDRVFHAHNKRCHISGREIRPGDPWDMDHVIALCNWTGEGHGNRESNLAPALRDKHKNKTAEDVAEKAHVSRKRKTHAGIKAKRNIMPGSRDSKWKRRMNGTVEER